MDLGILAEYGRWLGVNWVWALQLTIYHAVVSIAIPIMLVELLFPAHRHQAWLRKRGVFFYAALLLATLAFGPLMGMKAPFLAYVGSVIVIGLLIGLAVRWPVREEPRVKPVRPLKPGWFFLLGFVGMVSIFFPLWILPEQNVPVFYTLLMGISLPCIFAALAWIMGGRSWADRHRWALTAGAILVFILLAFIAESDAANRPDDPSGMALVGLAFLVFTIWAGIRVKRRERRISDTQHTPIAAAPIDKATQESS
jgi:drug/metabolite transporter (DMT)-like permease